MPRATVLPPAQHSAAASTINRPSGVVWASVCAAITATPDVASASASHWKPRSRSPVAAMARPMVKKTWVWMTSEASPGAMWPPTAR